MYSSSILSWQNLGHSKSRCQTVSSQLGSQTHEGLFLRWNLWRYAENPPCPVRIWMCVGVRTASLSVLFAARTFGKNTFVTAPVLQDSYRACHFLMVPVFSFSRTIRELCCTPLYSLLYSAGPLSHSLEFPRGPSARRISRLCPPL